MRVVRAVARHRAARARTVGILSDRSYAPREERYAVIALKTVYARRAR